MTTGLLMFSNKHESRQFITVWHCQSIQPKRIYLKNNKKGIISKLNMLPAYPKSLSDNIELVRKVDLKQRIWTSRALWDPNADQ